MKSKLKFVAGLVGLAIGCSSVQAATAWTWNMTDSSSPLINGSSPTGGPAVTVTGYTAPGNSTALSGVTPTLFAGSGYGICDGGNCSSYPNHAMDNEGGKESMLLSFGSSVSLTQLALGWAYHDTDGSSTNTSWNLAGGADVSVLAYVGSGTPVPATRTYGGATGLLANGWQLVGSYANVGSTQSISTGVSSSYWLIAAYNSVFGGSCTACTDSNDFMKLTSVAGTTPTTKVPEPSALLLVGTALLGAAGLRRRPAESKS